MMRARPSPGQSSRADAIFPRCGRMTVREITPFVASGPAFSPVPARCLRDRTAVRIILRNERPVTQIWCPRYNPGDRCERVWVDG